MKKIIALILTLGLTVMVLASCKTDYDPVAKAIGGKTYVCEKEGLGGDFEISFTADNRYSYREGPSSSYKGYGIWTMQDGLLLMKDRSGYSLVFRFAIENDGDTLVYQGAISSDFWYVKIEDGTKFNAKK